MSTPAEKPQKCDLCGQDVARAGSVIEQARIILFKALMGKLHPASAEVQRKAALDLAGGTVALLADEDLLAECKRRGLSAGAPAVDLDAAEAAVLAGKA